MRKLRIARRDLELGVEEVDDVIQEMKETMRECDAMEQ